MPRSFAFALLSFAFKFQWCGLCVLLSLASAERSELKGTTESGRDTTHKAEAERAKARHTQVGRAFGLTTPTPVLCASAPQSPPPSLSPAQRAAMPPPSHACAAVWRVCLYACALALLCVPLLSLADCRDCCSPNGPSLPRPHRAPPVHCFASQFSSVRRARAHPERVACSRTDQGHADTRSRDDKEYAVAS
jgi:hypothetical protein